MSNKHKKTVETIPEMEGYVTELRTIGMLKANIVALMVLGLVCLLGAAGMFAIWGGFSLGNPWNGMLFIVGFWLGIAVHELIHGFTWMWATRSGFRHLPDVIKTVLQDCDLDQFSGCQSFFHGIRILRGQTLLADLDDRIFFGSQTLQICSLFTCHIFLSISKKLF